MRDALKTIAGFTNESQDPREPGQAAANLARQTLDALDLFFEEDKRGREDRVPKARAT